MGVRLRVLFALLGGVNVAAASTASEFSGGKWEKGRRNMKCYSKCPLRYFFTSDFNNHISHDYDGKVIPFGLLILDTPACHKILLETAVLKINNAKILQDPLLPNHKCLKH